MPSAGLVLVDAWSTLLAIGVALLGQSTKKTPVLPTLIAFAGIPALVAL
jgi:hypothetical protein